MFISKNGTHRKTERVKKSLLSISTLLAAAFLLLQMCFLPTQVLCKEKPPKIEAQVKEKNSLPKSTLPISSKKPSWVWRKKFQGYELQNLVMSWNGEKLLFSVRADNGSTTKEGDAIIALDENGRGIRDWRIDKKILSLSLSGNGETLTVEPEDHRLLYYKNWMTTDQKPRSLPFQVSAHTLAPSGRQMVLVHNKRLRIWDGDGSITDIKSYPEANNAFFPFVEKETRFLQFTDKGEIIMREGESILWRNKRLSASLLAASDLLQGHTIAVVSEGEILFFGEGGKMVGRTSISFPASSINCAPVGDLCAVYGGGDKSQEVSLFIPQGRELWRHTLKEAMIQASKVVVSNKGHVIAGIMEQSQWYLRVWNRSGSLLRNIPVEGGLKEFQVSWSGEKIAALTLDGRIIYFKL